jgi:hypothetical protein
MVFCLGKQLARFTMAFSPYSALVENFILV